MVRYVDSHSGALSTRFDARIARASSDKPFRLGVFGGTFDPVHVGHLILAEAAYAAASLDGVLFIPTGLPVRKMTSCQASAQQRYDMLALATRDNEHFDLSRIEIDREGPTYTIDTLRALNETYGEQARLFFICGKDSTQDLYTWKEAAEIARLVTVLDAERSGLWTEPSVEDSDASSGNVKNNAAHNNDDNKKVSFEIIPFEMPLIEVSSTCVRKRIKEGKTVRYLIPEDVERYIGEHRIYG